MSWLEIKQVKLHFNEPFEPLQKIEHLVIHHTSRIQMDVFEAHEFHQQERGWSGIGYNYFIEKNGDIVEGRGHNVGAHVYGHNRTTLGICITGDFEIEQPTDAQYRSLIKLCDHLLKEHSLPVDCIVGHRDLDSKTSCPGKNVNFAIIRNKVLALRAQQITSR